MKNEFLPETNIIQWDVVELFYEPRKQILPQISNVKGEPEMTEFESAFLCGVLKKFHPHKIVEVGIAGGGTTAIITQCMVGLDQYFELHSVDILEKFYRDRSKSSGYMGMEADEVLKNYKYGHNYYLGNVACSFSDVIGGNIDCLILDTSHISPGELIEFITLLPFLKKGCIVVLHDLVLSHYSCDMYKTKWATGLLFSVVKGTKYLNHDSGRRSKFPNIGAFLIEEDTIDNIEDLFLSLMIPWGYVPDHKNYMQYKRCITETYNKDCIELFDMAYMMNSKTVLTSGQKWAFPFFDIPDNCNLVIYGASEIGRAFRDQIWRKQDINLVKWIDQKYEVYENLGVESVEAIKNCDYDKVVIATDKKDVADDMMQTVMALGCPKDKIVWRNPRQV